MKKWAVIPAIALVVAGIAAIAGVYVQNEAASGKGKWVQTLATIDRVEPRSVAYRYNSGGRAHASAAPLLPNDRFAPGGKVLIYVNPADPRQSLLHLPARPPQGPMMAGMVAVIVGVSLALYVWRATKTPRRSARNAKSSLDSTQNGKNGARKASPPMSRLRPPPQVVRKPAEDTEEA